MSAETHDCLHCSSPIARIPGKPGQPAKLHDDCRQPYFAARAAQRRAAKMKEGREVRSLPGRFCGKCYDIPDRRPLGGCVCGEPHGPDNEFYNMPAGEGWTFPVDSRGEWCPVG